MIVMPSARQLAQDREQPPGLALVERGVGLVEDEHAWPLDEHAADLDQLALVEAQVADERVRVDGEPDARSTGARAPAHLGAVDEAAAGSAADRGTGWPGSTAPGRG